MILHEGHDWFDQREFFMLTSARMDLERFEPHKDSGKQVGEPDGDAA